jgi:two-component system, OmpR family, sensor kinase
VISRLTAAYLTIFALVLIAISAVVYTLLAAEYHSLLLPALATPEGAAVYANSMRRVLLAIAGADVPLLVVVGLASWFLARLSVRPLLAAQARERAFVADAAHELRSPLAAIATVAQAARAYEDAATIRESLDTIAESAMDASALIADLLTLARSPEPALLVREPVDLAAIAQGCASEFAPRAAAASVVLDLRVRSAIVDGDARRLRELLRNLLENALRHASSSITIEAGTEAKRAFLRVSDDGPGVEPSIRTHLFDRFVSGAQSTGLGLSIAQWVARAHEGTLALDEQRPGASFVALFPALS